jgi:hypothetical protein
MNLLLTLLRLHLPTCVKQEGLRDLFACTAAAFQCDVPRLDGLSFDGCLHAYALFTRENAAEALQSGQDLDALQDRLYQNAFQLGQRLRKRLRITAIDDVMAAGRTLFCGLGIDFEGKRQGTVTIRRCYFSRFYSPQVCALISALDAGVLAGLAGGGSSRSRNASPRGTSAVWPVLPEKGGRHDTRHRGR